MFPSKVFPRPSSRSFSDQLRMRKRTDFRFEKKAEFPAILNWIIFFIHGTFQPQIQNIAKDWFFKIIFFEKVTGILVSFVFKKNIFQNKKETMLGWIQKRIQIIKPSIKYPNCVARRKI